MMAPVTLRLSDEKANHILEEGLKVTGLRNKADYLTQLIRKYGPQFNEEAKPFSTCCCGNASKGSRSSKSNKSSRATQSAQAVTTVTPESLESDELLRPEANAEISEVPQQLQTLPSMLDMLK